MNRMTQALPLFYRICTLQALSSRGFKNPYEHNSPSTDTLSASLPHSPMLRAAAKYQEASKSFCYSYTQVAFPVTITAPSKTEEKGERGDSICTHTNTLLPPYTTWSKKCNCNENTTWKVNHVYTKYGLVLPLLLLFGNTYMTGWCLRCTKNKVTMSEFNLTHMLTCMQCAFSSVQISVDSLETDVKTGLWATVISLLGRIIYSGETEQTCFRACKILCSHSIQFLSRFFPSAKCLLLIWMLFLFKLLQVIKITAFCTGRESSAARWCGLLPESTPACAQHCTFAQFPTVLSVTYPRHNLLCKENSSWVFFVCFFPVLRSRHQHAVQISERLRHL